MKKTLMMAASAMLLAAGTQIGYAQSYNSCVRDAVEQRQDCLREGPRYRARIAHCNAEYRDDLSECHRYQRGWRGPGHYPPPRYR